LSSEPQVELRDQIVMHHRQSISVLVFQLIVHNKMLLSPDQNPDLSISNYLNFNID
jgi:hypothetical protein